MFSLVLLALLGLVLSIVMARAAIAAQAAVRAADRAGALNAAEAGLADAVQRLHAELASPGDELERKIGECAVSVTVEAEGVDGPWDILDVTSVGTCRRTSQPLVLRLALRHHPGPHARPQLAFVRWREGRPTVAR